MADSDIVPPTRQALAEALSLSAEILQNIELNEIPLTSIALKSSRLARLLNEFDYQKIMALEAGGYPNTPSGVSPDIWQLGGIAGRILKKKASKSEEIKEYMYIESIGQIEDSLKVAATAIDAARDPDISVSSANPNQYVSAGIVNRFEREQIRATFSDGSQKLASRRSFIYSYILRKHYELKYSGIADDIFTRIRERVDDKIGRLLPSSVQKISAVYGSLLSENPENWANAVHSCRRILQDLADVLFPPTDKERTMEVEGKKRTIKLGNDQYINRIMAFIQDTSDSERFTDIVGSHLAFLGNRLDGIFKAAQKGSHNIIISREEADRYVVYTYLVVGDILTLYDTT